MPHLVDALSEGLQTECERGCFDHGAAAEDVAAADRKRDNDLKDVAPTLAGRIRCERVETGGSDSGRVFMLASPDSSEAEEVNKLCVRSSPADVCFVEEEQQASCGQTWRSRVNNRPHGRAAAAALQRAVDAEEVKKKKNRTLTDTRLPAEGHVSN